MSDKILVGLIATGLFNSFAIILLACVVIQVKLG